MQYGIGDIILNFPTMSVNRNLHIEESAPSVATFVGDEDWQDLYPLNIDTFLGYFMGKLRRYRSEVHSLTINGDGNHRLFDLIFITNSMGMKNSLDDLKERLDTITTKNIRGLYSVVAEGQRQIYDWFQ